MRLRTGLVPLIVSLMLLSVAAQAATINSVTVNERPDRIEIDAVVTGGVEAWTNQSSIGEWITLDIRGDYGCKPVRLPVQTQTVKAVKAGWFRAKPPLTRIAVSTTAKVPYELLRLSDDKLRLVVWKTMNKAEAPEAAAAPAPAEQVKPAAVAVAPKAAPAESKALNVAGAPSSSVMNVTPAGPEVRFDQINRVAQAVDVTDDAVHQVMALAQPGRPKMDWSAFKPEPRTKVAGSREVLDPEAPAADPQPVMVAALPGAGTPVAAAAPKPASGVTLNFVGTDINDVLKALTMQAGVNVVTAKDVQGEVTVALQDVNFESALDSITKLSGYRWTRDDNTYYVASDQSIASFQAKGDTSTEVVAFARATADDMLGVVNTQYPDLKASIPTGKTDGHSLILAGPPALVDRAKALIAQVDNAFLPQSGETVVDVYRIRHARASSLISSLNSIVPQVSVSAGSVPAALKLMPPDDKRGTVYTLDEEKEESSGSGQPGESTASTVDPDISRMLILLGLAQDVARARDLLARIDIASPQVSIEAKVVDLTLTDDLRKGFLYNQDINGFNIGVSGRSGNAEVADGTNTIRNFDMFLNASVEAEIQEGRANLLAHPKISVLDNQPATIFIGDQITYIQSIQATTSGITVTTDKVSAGVELGCLPLVNVDEGTIALKIHPEVSTPTLVQDKETGVTLPQIATRFADSTIRVKDGETIVIGGLINQREFETLTRIPFLSELPFLGQLFRHRERAVTERELVIFITCRILQEQE